jgi:molybdopterin converting factor small subunit
MSSLGKKASPNDGEARFRFYEELNDGLPEASRKVETAFRFNQPCTVREAIESFGVRPDDVDLVLANGVSVDFGYFLKDGDRVSVYPIFERFDISGITNVREKPLIKIRRKVVGTGGSQT